MPKKTMKSKANKQPETTMTTQPKMLPEISAGITLLLHKLKSTIEKPEITETESGRALLTWKSPILDLRVVITTKNQLEYEGSSKVEAIGRRRLRYTKGMPTELLGILLRHYEGNLS